MAKKTIDNTNIRYYSDGLAGALKEYADSGDLPNLLALSDQLQNSLSYALGWYPTYDTLETGKTYTLTMLATVGDRDDSVGIYADGGTQTNIGTYARAKSGTIQSFTFQAPAGTNQISFFHRPNDSDFDSDSAVLWAVLTEGTRGARRFRPAPQDLMQVRHTLNINSVTARQMRLIKPNDWFYYNSRVQGPVISNSDTVINIFRTYDRSFITYKRENGKLVISSSTLMASQDDVTSGIEGRWVELTTLGSMISGLATAGTCTTMSTTGTGIDMLLVKLHNDQDTPADNFPCRNVGGVFATHISEAWYFPLSSLDVEGSDFDYIFNFGPAVINKKTWFLEIKINQGAGTASVCLYPL